MPTPPRVRRTPWWPHRILDALRADAAERGRTPSERDWQNTSPSHPSAYRVALVFGSWARAIERAGLPPAPVGRPKKASA